MIVSPGLAKRVGIAKGVGFLFGLVGFICLPYFWPEADWMTRWGILLWYGTLGGIIGLFGASTPHPVLKFDMPWWFLAPFLGAWMNFVLTFFAYDMMAEVMLSTFGADGMLSSPYWFVAEGAVIGLVISYVAIKFGGDD
ncbi:MAG: hypothetical protein HQ514_01505 [Rhodospirillales bacterium]|nr:hypothetical protein [Rhodospirillales bacterium]